MKPWLNLILCVMALSASFAVPVSYTQQNNYNTAHNAGQELRKNGKLYGFKAHKRGGPAMLTAHTECRVIINEGNNEHFIPLNTSREWIGSDGFVNRGTDHDPDLHALPCTGFIYGSWSPWSAWSGSATESRTRTRTCHWHNNPAWTDTTCSACGGDCTQTATRGPWSSYGSCSNSCGSGTQQRQRTCNLQTGASASNVTGSACDSACGGCTESTNCTSNSGCANCGSTPHGNSEYRCASSNVSFGNSCNCASSTCNNGTFSPPLRGNATSCSIQSARNCGSLAHGQSRTYYRNSNVPFGQSCHSGGNSQTRSCFDGNLSGSNNHSSTSCSVAPPPSYRSCTAGDGRTVSHGGELNDRTATCNNRCGSQSANIYRCNDGNFVDTGRNTTVNCGACAAPPPSSGPWSTSGWSSCSASCGGGTQTRSVSCNYDSCTGPRPANSQSCNTQACPPPPAVDCNNGRIVGRTRYTYEALTDTMHPLCPCGALTGGRYKNAIVCSSGGGVIY